MTARCAICQKFADHDALLVSCPLVVPSAKISEREVWDFRKAQWDKFMNRLEHLDWEFISDMSIDAATDRLTTIILNGMHDFIPKKMLKENILVKSTPKREKAPRQETKKPNQTRTAGGVELRRNRQICRQIAGVAPEG